MKLLKKMHLGLISILYWTLFKILYRSRVNMHVINSIRGSLHLEMLKDSSLSIVDFLMSRGPLYIKCMEGAQLDIGDNVFFNHNCSITTAKRISIGSNCMIANNVVIVDHNHVVKMEGSTSELACEEITIGDSVWIGANVTITMGVHIGNGAVIGANSVVVHDVEAHAVYAGVPAKKIKSLHEEQ